MYAYYVFETIQTNYYNKLGKLVNYNRCTWVDKRATINELIELLQEYASRYLQQSCYISCDFVFWPKFKSSCQYPILHFDCSENIKFIPKHEAQSARFSGQQHTLHSHVLQDNIDGVQKNIFLYHIFDDTTRNSIMTFTILEDILTNYPQIMSSGHIVIRSDNCSTQYKSRYTFVQISKLASKYKKQLTWFYEEPDHGRGLPDAMSSFGHKNPLRHSIITEEKWNNSAWLFKKHFKNDPQKQYYQIDEIKTAEFRKKKKEEIKIARSSKIHMLLVTPEGGWTKKRFTIWWKRHH